MTDHILSFWNQQAQTHGVDHAASWSDKWAVDLEINEIGKHIYSDQEILDVGCSNGYAMFEHIKKNPKKIVGIDFSESMIDQAIIAKDFKDIENKAEFRVADIRNIPFPAETFDLVYTTRVLINLPTWEDQKVGIDECLRVCRKGGKVLFSEGFWEPLILLNSIRSLVGLQSLVEHDFNRYLKKSRLEEYLKASGLSYQHIDFTSIYYLGSRLLRELVTDPSAYPGYSNPINKIFYEVEKEYSGGGFGIQQIYVITK